MLSTLHNFVFKVKIRKSLWIQAFEKCSTVTRSNTENSTETNWVKEKHDEILQVVNSSTLKQLSKYIQASWAKSIISHRTINGSYKSLDDLLSKNGIEPDVLNKFYTSIIDHKMQQKKWKRYIVTPDIKTIEVPETTVGIHIGPTAITWTVVSRDSKIVDWDCLIWRDKTSKICTYDLINLAPSIVQKLPLSSCYVMEEFQIARKALRDVICAQQQLTIAVMSCLKLMEQQRLSNSLSKGNSVYMLQPLTSARFFNLVVGNEIIATEYITNLVLHSDEKDDKKFENVGIDDEIKRKYIERNAEEKEQMGWSLLKALAFIRLLVLFNTNALYTRNTI